MPECRSPVNTIAIYDTDTPRLIAKRGARSLLGEHEVHVLTGTGALKGQVYADLFALIES